MICPECGNPINDICELCGVFFETQKYQIDDLYNYTPIIKRSYNRIDHFKEVLNQFQGKEGRQIPNDIVQQIKTKINEKPITIKHALRELKLTKYVENTNYLEFIINNKPLPYIPKLIEEQIIKFFKQVDKTFDMLFKDKSFMSYYYIIFKLLESMGETELIKEVPLLKTKSRIRQSDKIYKLICEELDWRFNPTI